MSCNTCVFVCVCVCVCVWGGRGVKAFSHPNLILSVHCSTTNTMRIAAMRMELAMRVNCICSGKWINSELIYMDVQI